MSAVEFDHLISLIKYPFEFAGAFLVGGFLLTRLAFRDHPTGRFVCQLVSFVGFTAMLCVAGVVPFEATPPIGRTVTYFVISSFKIAWWFAASWLLTGFFSAALVFKRRPRETRFLQDLISGFIYVAATLAIIAYVFDTPVSGLLAASGVIAIVLGLALQSTLADVFSGVALNLAKPYHPGDWVILDGGLQGRVIETNWRATLILTDDNDVAIVPNSVIAKAKLINASSPTRAHGVTIIIRLDPSMSPSRCRAVLEMALLNSNRIVRVPPPNVMVRQLDAAAIECELQFFVATIDDVLEAQNEMFDLAFRHATSAGIRFAPPSGSSIVLPDQVSRPEPKDIPRLLLEHLPIFAPLSEAERLALAPKMTRRTYMTGDVLVEQGVVAHALFILATGVLSFLQGGGSRETEVLRLAPGHCFGQSCLLTGAVTSFKVKALTSVTVYEIAKDDLAPILKERPAIARELGQILARREAAGEALLEELTDHGTQGEGLADRLAARVKGFFGLI